MSCRELFFILGNLSRFFSAISELARYYSDVFMDYFSLGKNQGYSGEIIKSELLGQGFLSIFKKGIKEARMSKDDFCEQVFTGISDFPSHLLEKSAMFI
jgi:hypothetical protein